MLSTVQFFLQRIAQGPSRDVNSKDCRTTQGISVLSQTIDCSLTEGLIAVGRQFSLLISVRSVRRLLEQLCSPSLLGKA